MTQFRGKATVKLDSKGRVSVPALFRGRLSPDDGLVLRRSPRHPCIEAWPASSFDDTGPGAGPLDEPSDEDEALDYALFSDVHDVAFDPEGRVLLPRELAAHAGLAPGAMVAMLARRSFFEIWEEGAAEAKIEASRGLLAARRARQSGGEEA